MSQAVKRTDATRLSVTRLVARDVSQWVNDDDAVLDLVVNDVLACWRERDRQSDEPVDLVRFWNEYANQVEFAPAGSDNQFRPEFCPDPPGPMDTDVYYRAVWLAHAANLIAATSAPRTAA
jgi:hypothetical protein